jgi:UDP-N-acetylmuramoylalanine--D-glutamate ligase
LGGEVFVVAGDDDLPKEKFDFAVASPGISLSHRWFEELRKSNVKIISEMQLGVEHLKRQNYKIIAVTGSKGKSSVVKLLAQALSAVPCGNYGLPVSAASSPSKCAVVEVSSFMMETTDLPSDTFECAAIVNLQEDHLDRHGTVEHYHALKRKLLSMAVKKVDVPVDFSTVGNLDAIVKGSYFDNEVLKSNAAIAISVLRECSVAEERIRGAFENFEPLPHRMQFIDEINGVKFLNDSKSTSLESLAAAVEMCKDSPVRLIAGGRPKGENPKNYIFCLTKHVKKVYLIGESAELFFKSWSRLVECQQCQTLEKAFKAVLHEASSGDVVLLSPGAASYDQFKNFEHRGDVFAGLVKIAKGKKYE